MQTCRIVTLTHEKDTKSVKTDTVYMNNTTGNESVYIVKNLDNGQPVEFGTEMEALQFLAKAHKKSGYRITRSTSMRPRSQRL